MKYHILSIGKWKKDSEKNLFSYYNKLLNNNIELVELEYKKKTSSISELKQKEAEVLDSYIKKLPDNSIIIALDENGKQHSSKSFSKLVSKFKRNGSSNIAFIMGGAYGLSKEIIKFADDVLSLSEMTFPHLLCRVILSEQIYRAESISKGHPYHK